MFGKAGERKTLRSLNLLNKLSEKHSFNLQDIDDKNLRVIRNKSFRRNLAFSGAKTIAVGSLIFALLSLDLSNDKGVSAAETKIFKNAAKAFMFISVVSYLLKKIPQDGNTNLRKELVEKITAPPEKPSGTELE